MYACRCVGVRAECGHTHTLSLTSAAFTRHHQHQGPSPPDALGVVPLEQRAPCGRDWAGPQSPKTANRRPRALDPLACCERSHLARWRVAEVDAGSSRALTLLSLLSLLSLLPSLHDQDSPPRPPSPWDGCGWRRSRCAQSVGGGVVRLQMCVCVICGGWRQRVARVGIRVKGVLMWVWRRRVCILRGGWVMRRRDCRSLVRGVCGV